MPKKLPPKAKVKDNIYAGNKYPRSLRHVLISELTQYPGNARKGSTKQITASLLEHGFITPVVVQKKGMIIVVGNNRVRVAKKLLGDIEVPALILDCDDAEARKFLVHDNRTSDEATYDEELQAKLFEHIGSSEEELAGTGYTPREVDAIKARAEWQDESQLEELEEPVKETHKEGQEVTGVLKRPRAAERTKTLEQLAIRAVILSIPMEHHEAIAEALKEAREDFAVKTNEEAVVHLLQEAGYLDVKLRLFNEKKEGKKPSKKKGKKK